MQIASTYCFIAALLYVALLASVAATTCRTGQFQCGQNNSSTSVGQITCIPDEHLCDGRLHCPLGDDEKLDLCNRRSCGSDQFACQSPGHCIPASRKCDGQFDCRRTGLDDQSDEQNCVVNKPLTVSVCSSDQFACKDGHGCVSKLYQCDGFSDCDDRSDESNCPLNCKANEFQCDGNCMKSSLMCDGFADCKDGKDELGCQKSDGCSFNSEIRCRNGNKCISKIFLCDTSDDCGSGDDEVCPIDKEICKSDKYWTCKSGTHCILSGNRCDSMTHCPDGSDEVDCPTTVPPPAKVVCAPGHHLCNGTRTCVDIVVACSGRDHCPQPDSELDDSCKKFHSARSPCADANGGCEQLCEPTMDGTTVVAKCTCRPGYQTSPSDPRLCVDVDECKQFGACSQLCSNTIGSFSCSCMSGYRAHGSTCLAHGAAKLLFSTDSTVEYMDMETGSRVNVLTGLHYPKYLAYDHANQEIFYHGRDGNLNSIRLDGTQHKELLRGITVDAIAYDWTRRLLFYSTPKEGSTSGHVGVVDVSSGRRAVLRVLDCPRGLAVSPSRFSLYVTLRCGSRPGVYAMQLDGGNFRLIVDPSGLPGHLAIDLAQTPERLYWTDAHLQGVYSGTVEGRDLRVHVHKKYPFDLALFQDRLFFTDIHKGKLYSTSKFAPDAPIDTKLSAHSVLSVTAYHSLMQPRTAGDSAMQQCNCQHICLAPPTGKPICLCDINYRMDSASGRCVNDTRTAAGGIIRMVSGPSTASPSQEAGSPLDGQVGSIAGIVIGALCVCLIFGAAVAVYCLRVQDRQSVQLGGDVPYCKQVGSMPKVNSRTPLTECEIDMDNANSNSNLGKF